MHREKKFRRPGIWRLLLVCICLLLFVPIEGCKSNSACLTDAECEAGTHCKLADGTCATECKEDRDCQAKENCKSAKDGCECEKNRGRCKSKKKICTPKAKKECKGSKIFWLDSCDYPGEEVEDCGKKGCLDGKCKQGSTCGDGSCEPGLEDCLSCAKDCACQQDEQCTQNGTCEKVNNCGNGKCDKGEEDCSSCSQDCRCPNGEICDGTSCKKQASCGNGKCEANENENCISCPGDCVCQGGEVCRPGSKSCQKACGDGKCEAKVGENCSTCLDDCKCRQGTRCSQGRCEKTCGNGRCESSYGEDCDSCKPDCACPAGLACKAGSCGSDCGNGKCEADKKEDCSTCPKDCGCGADKYCESGNCKPWCGNSICDQSKGENCEKCAKDCSCTSTHFCDAGSCKPKCGDGKCEASIGENCATCGVDCKCKGAESCVGGKCSCVPNCSGKTCGDDGCGGSCGSCTGRTQCEKGKCACRHDCKAGESKCLGSGSYERCEQDTDGCRYFKSQNCKSGQVCKNGSCCASACGTKECGPDGCGGSCGTCSKRASCTSGKCVCKHECAENAGQCIGTGSYKECLKDTGGCRYWAPVKACGKGRLCVAKTGKCCTPVCTNKECGTNGCGGDCGKCAYGCTNSQCKRRVVAVSVYFPCGLCKDNFLSGDPDIYLKFFPAAGSELKNGDKSTKCNRTVTYNWTLPSMDKLALKGVKIELWDDDGILNHDFCARWSNLDLTSPGKRTYTSSAHKNAKITIEVKK